VFQYICEVLKVTTDLALSQTESLVLEKRNFAIRPSSPTGDPLKHS